MVVIAKQGARIAAVAAVGGYARHGGDHHSTFRHGAVGSETENIVSRPTPVWCVDRLSPDSNPPPTQHGTENPSYPGQICPTTSMLRHIQVRLIARQKQMQQGSVGGIVHEGTPVPPWE